MAKVQKEAVYLVSSVGTGHFYTIRRNRKKKTQEKLSVFIYDPIARKRVKYDEGKLKELDRKTKFKRPKVAAGAEAKTKAA